MTTSIATKHGDKGETGLVGGVRVWKSSLRVEAYGNVDELNSCMGFARSICLDEAICESTKQIQRELFQLGAALATPSSPANKPMPVTEEMVDSLTAQVHRIEAMEGILSDWSLPGEHDAASAYDVARTVCRRAERGVVRMIEAGETVAPNVIPYLNRLSDLLWLFGRLLEFRAGVNTALRDARHAGPRWSKAWGDPRSR